jgi:hypothetical protein
MPYESEWLKPLIRIDVTIPDNNIRQMDISISPEAIKTVSLVGKSVGVLSGWAFGAWKWWKERKSSNELKAIKARAHAPFLAPSFQAFHQLYTNLGNNSAGFQTPGQANLLCWMRSEVDKSVVPDGTPILFVIENNGEAVRRKIVRLEGTEVLILAEPDIDSAQALIYLQYPYSSSKHGQTQNLKIWFETTSGIQASHTYHLRHGFRYIERVDPK